MRAVSRTCFVNECNNAAVRIACTLARVFCFMPLHDHAAWKCVRDHSNVTRDHGICANMISHLYFYLGLKNHVLPVAVWRKSRDGGKLFLFLFHFMTGRVVLHNNS